MRGEVGTESPLKKSGFRHILMTSHMTLSSASKEQEQDIRFPPPPLIFFYFQKSSGSVSVLDRRFIEKHQINFKNNAYSLNQSQIFLHQTFLHLFPQMFHLMIQRNPDQQKNFFKFSLFNIGQMLQRSPQNIRLNNIQHFDCTIPV